MLRLLSSPGGSDAGASCPRVTYLDRFPGPVRLGRHTDCEIRCLAERNREVLNAAISRFHAQLTRSGGEGYVVKDTSANGTVVNGHRINGPQILRAGDVITLGMPTYKATSDASTDVTNPFVFEYTAPQDLSMEPFPALAAASGDLQYQNPAQEVLGQRLKGEEKDRATPSLPEARAYDRRWPGSGERNTLPRQVDNSGNQAEVPDLGRYQAHRSLVDTSAGVSRREAKGALKLGAYQEPKGNADPTRTVIDLSEGLPELGAEAETRLRRRTPWIHLESSRLFCQDQKESASETPDGRGTNCLEASIGRELEEDGVPISKGALDKDEDGREKVRKRMLEVVRAKHRADKRQSPFNKRGPKTETHFLELLPKSKRLRTQGGVSESAPWTGTPVSLADDCGLLEVPEVDTSAVRSRTPIDLNIPQNADFLEPASLENVEHGEAREAEMPLRPPPEAPLLDSAPSPAEAIGRPEACAQGEKPVEASGKRSGEAELLEVLGEEMQCVICQSYLCAAHALPCSHTFCGDCLTEWLSKKRHCPTCRQPIGSASPTPVHNIDSMIERAAKRCMTSEEKADFDRRRGVFKMSKKLTSDAPRAAEAPALQMQRRRMNFNRPRNFHTPTRSGTMQAISSHVDEALARLDERERRVRQEMVRRLVQPQPSREPERTRAVRSHGREADDEADEVARSGARRAWQQRARRATRPQGAQGEGHGTRPFAALATEARSLDARMEGSSAQGGPHDGRQGNTIPPPVKSPLETGEATCGVCGQAFAQGQLQIAPRDGRNGPKCHFGCLSGLPNRGDYHRALSGR